ncbi:MAG: DUF1636 domain-containing protein [Roseovarius sp.]|nr:DUF1636 domain-containing protein [Roseovarius sp.]
MTTWITICDTCKRDDWYELASISSDGEEMAELVEKHAMGRPVATRRVSCLMGCTHGCNVTIQAPGKITYTLGGFKPEDEAASAIVSYAEMHAESETGQVPFRKWPQGIKGHFITRHLPLPDD